MSYNFTIANSQYLTAPLSSVTGTPITMCCWFNRRQTNIASTAFALASTTTTNFHLMQLAVNGQLSCNSNSNGNLVLGISSTNIISTGIWYHGAAIFANASSRTAYLNGSQVANNTQTVSPTGMNSINIGARPAGGAYGVFANDYIAEVGVWNVALSTDELNTLSKGISCNSVRPQSLVFYSPLIRNLIDNRGGLTITNVNTATVYDHPRIYY